MGQARIKKLKLQREIAAQNPTASPEQLAKLLTQARGSVTTMKSGETTHPNSPAGNVPARKAKSAQPSEPGRVLMSDVGPINATQLRTNANHEAGHAVIMTRIAYGCEVVTVDPQEVKRLTGHAMPGFTRPAPKPLDVETYLCTTLAGITSEAMFGNGMISAHEDDLVHAEEILDRAGLQGAERKQQFLAARMRTQQLVTQYKHDIESVADALVTRLTLTGEEVRTLIENPPTEQQGSSEIGTGKKEL